MSWFFLVSCVQYSYTNILFDLRMYYSTTLPTLFSLGLLYYGTIYYTKWVECMLGKGIDKIFILVLRLENDYRNRVSCVNTTVEWMYIYRKSKVNSQILTFYVYNSIMTQ